MTTNAADVRRYVESERLAALARYDVLDTPRERELDDIVAIAAQICGVPTALITLIDDKRQWFKAAIGIDLSETPREIAFCDHAIDEVGMMIVEDATRDPRFLDNPLVTGDPHVRFYAGAQLVTPDGLPLGTLCVLDAEPRQLSDDQKRALEALGRQVMSHFELRRLLAQKRADEKELRESETRGRLALDVAELGAWEAIPATGQLFGDDRARELMGRSPFEELSFDGFLDHVHVDDRARFAAAVDAMLSGANDGRLDIEFRATPPSADLTRWLRSRAQAIKLPGERHRMVGTIRDISAERTAEEHRKLLNNELQHRVKNTLGVVQGIVTQSLRTVATPAEARDAIGSRLSTLAHAHDLLTQTSWKAAPIAAIIDGAVLAHCGEPERVTANGPKLELKARSALALSMALHELFTNAVKYGALSNDLGTISLTWKVTPIAGEDDRFDLAWHEHGGPPVMVPVRSGFGSRLTGSSLAGDLGGAGVIDYAPDGVRWTLSTTVAAISEEAVSF